MLLVQNTFVRKILYIFTSAIFQKWSHLSFCLSSDISVLNFLETPSVQPLITLASDLYSVRWRSLIFQKTNKEPTENPEPFYFLTSVQNGVREPSRASGGTGNFSWVLKGQFRSKQSQNVFLTDMLWIFSASPLVCLPVCEVEPGTFLFTSSNGQTLGKNSGSEAVSSPNTLRFGPHSVGPGVMPGFSLRHCRHCGGSLCPAGWFPASLTSTH